MPIPNTEYSRARRAAKRAGLVANRSNYRRNSINNHGGFQISDPLRNLVLYGDRYELTADEVVDICAEYNG